MRFLNELRIVTVSQQAASPKYGEHATKRWEVYHVIEPRHRLVLPKSCFVPIVRNSVQLRKRYISNVECQVGREDTVQSCRPFGAVSGLVFEACSARMTSMSVFFAILPSNNVTSCSH
jgi:hypothetical protein